MNLLSTPILSIAISIVICWALFAMLCSMIHESVTRVKAERGRFMKQYLLQQLHDYPNDINWAKLLYAHGSIDLLSRAVNKPTSNIAPELFASVMIDIVGQSQLVQRKKDAAAEAIRYQNPLLHDFKAATLVLQPSDVMVSLKQFMDNAELRSTVNGTVDESKVYELLLANIAQWFTELTGRITEWYQKKTRMRLFMLGVLIALLINVDSIQLFNLFSKDDNSRGAILHLYQQNEEWLEKQAKSDTAQADMQSMMQQTQAYEKKIDSLSQSLKLPVGMGYSIIKRSVRHAMSWNEIWTKLLGILISGFAASFGAPFWFNLLKRTNNNIPKRAK